MGIQELFGRENNMVNRPKVKTLPPPSPQVSPCGCRRHDACGVRVLCSTSRLLQEAVSNCQDGRKRADQGANPPPVKKVRAAAGCSQTGGLEGSSSGRLKAPLKSSGGVNAGVMAPPPRAEGKRAIQLSSQLDGNVTARR